MLSFVMACASCASDKPEIKPLHPRQAQVSQPKSMKIKPMKPTVQVYLESLGQIESADNDRAKGSHGEISRYQCLKSVWREATSAPYGKAVDKKFAEQVVLCIVWNRTGEDINKLTPSQFAREWHCPNAKRLNREQRDYVNRFKNLCEVNK